MAPRSSFDGSKVPRFRRWLAAHALIGLLALWVAAVATGPGLSSQTSAALDTPNITIAGPGVAIAVGSSFNVQVSVESVETAINAYQVEIDVPAGLTFMSGTHEATGTFPSCLVWSENGDQPPQWWVTTCARGIPDVPFAGLVETVTLRCDSDGTFPLNLVDANEDPSNGSGLADLGGPVLTNTTPDDQETVTCNAAPAAAGGIAEVPPIAGGPAEETDAPAEGSGWSADSHAALAGLGAGAAAVVAGSAWYVRRRWFR